MFFLKMITSNFSQYRFFLHQ